MKPLLLAITVASLAAAPGCAMFGSGKLQQCQSESERLLSDYRQQRDRADRLEDQNRLMNDRLAQLEQRLAELQQSPDQRLATRPTEQAVDRATEQATEQPSSSSPTTPPDAAPAASDAPAADAPPAADVPIPDPWRAAPREREKL